MPQCPIESPALLLPHSGPMVLLDRVVFYDDKSLIAHAHIAPDHVLLPENAQALPVYLATEILAQAVGAWAGAQALDQGENVKLGFLLGTRKMVFPYPDIPIGTQLIASIHQSWQDHSGMGVFDCELRAREATAHCKADEILLQCALNVFSPTQTEDLEKLLNNHE